MTQKRMNKSQNKIELKIKAGWVIQLFTLEGWNKSVPWLAKNRLVYCHKIAKFHNQGTCDRHISRSSGWRLGKIKSLRVSKQFLPSETIRRVFDYLTQENRGELATVAFKILFRVSRPWLLIECIGISRWASWTSHSGTRGWFGFTSITTFRGATVVPPRLWDWPQTGSTDGRLLLLASPFGLMCLGKTFQGQKSVHVRVGN